MTEDDVSQVFRALGDTTRRMIIEELAARPRQSLFEIYTRVIVERGIGHSRQAFSRHLSVLERVGIIEVEWQGNTKLHSLNVAPIQEVLDVWMRPIGETK